MNLPKYGRCRKEMMIHSMSWFNTEEICEDC